MQHAIFTIGYEGVTIDAILTALKEADVQLLIDVRAVPLSRKPGFSKNKLAGRLAENNIRYVGLKGLGTPAAGRDAARKGKLAELRRIFTAHLATPEAEIALQEAIAFAQNENVCLLCFEHMPEACHRLIVAEQMAAQTGQTIQHLNPAIAHL